MAKDNSTLRSKCDLRRSLLAEIPNPVILEPYGGKGVIWWHCYQDVLQGTVIEKQEDKAETLARQRPTWAVFCGDSIAVLRSGACRRLTYNYIDIDPYGEPWETIDLVFGGAAPLARRVGIVVHDGLRSNLRMNTAWKVKAMQQTVAKWGNERVHDNYVAICREMLEKKAEQAGYRLLRWAGYYCGDKDSMTHYAAVLEATA